MDIHPGNSLPKIERRFGKSRRRWTNEIGVNGSIVR
jgi:hypothetical protein